MTPAAVVVSGSTQAAAEWNVARTAQHDVDGTTQIPLPLDGSPPIIYAAAIPSGPSRVMATLQGMWAGHDGLKCRHDGCLHAENLFPFVYSSLAREILGSDGGKQIQVIRAAIDYLTEQFHVLYLDPRTRTYEQRKGSLITKVERGRLPERIDTPDGSTVDAEVLISFAEPLHRSLMQGNYQLIPHELVRHTSKTTWQLWLAMLTRTPTGTRLKDQGDAPVEYNITGPSPSITPSRIGLGRQAKRPDRLRQSLERAVSGGNDVQQKYTATLLDRTGGDGLKVALRLAPSLEATEGADSVTSSHNPRHFKPAAPSLQAAKPVTSGHDSCSKQGIETVRDVQETKKRRSTDSSSSSTGMNPILKVLATQGWNRPSSKQLQRVQEVAQQRKLGTDSQVAEIIAKHYGGRDHQDLFVFLNNYRKPPRPYQVLCEADPSCDSSAFVASWDVPKPWLCSKCSEAAA